MGVKLQRTDEKVKWGSWLRIFRPTQVGSYYQVRELSKLESLFEQKITFYRIGTSVINQHNKYSQIGSSLVLCTVCVYVHVCVCAGVCACES